MNPQTFDPCPPPITCSTCNNGQHSEPGDTGSVLCARDHTRHSKTGPPCDHWATYRTPAPSHPPATPDQWTITPIKDALLTLQASLDNLQPTKYYAMPDPHAIELLETSKRDLLSAQTHLRALYLRLTNPTLDRNTRLPFPFQLS
jgi:hypothetical protein